MEIHLTPVKWFKEWVSQDVVATGGQCRILKWVNEGTIKAIREKNESEVKEVEAEPTTEVLFLCNHEGCGFTFTDAVALRRHSQMHGERQYTCHYEGCGKKFYDGSKLKRHLVIHTGKRDFVCPHEGCGKAHMKTHSQENYHTNPYLDCVESYAHEYKLKIQIAEHHEKNASDAMNHTPIAEKPQKTPKSVGGPYGSASSDRPYVCPYDGCEKAYIHAYKLNLHLRREHPGHFPDENAKNAQPSGNEMDEWSDQDALAGKHINSKFLKQSSKSKPSLKQPPSKVARMNVSRTSPGSRLQKHFPAIGEMIEEEDSEETEEELLD